MIDPETASEYLEIIPEMERPDLIQALVSAPQRSPSTPTITGHCSEPCCWVPELQAEIGETQHYDDDEEMRELLTMFYEDHLGVTESDDSEYESDDGGAGDFSALDQALEESEHFNPDSPWVEFKDERGKSYFFNSETDKTQWNMPEEGISGIGEDEDSEGDEEEDDDDEEEGDDDDEEGEEEDS